LREQASERKKPRVDVIRKVLNYKLSKVFLLGGMGGWGGGISPRFRAGVRKVPAPVLRNEEVGKIILSSTLFQIILRMVGGGEGVICAELFFPVCEESSN
jgi:hypothetical protein